jgi:hypothetical protein
MQFTKRVNEALEAPAKIQNAVGVAVIIACIAMMISFVAIGLGLRNAN